MSVGASPSRRLADNICKMYGVQRVFMDNLAGALADRRKKCVVLLVDLDNVPKCWQEKSANMISKHPSPVFVFGSANAEQDARLASTGNFHFSLALKIKDAADAVLNMIAASMQALLAVHDRVGDVAVIPISDDKIFDQTAATLRKGGSPATTVSRSNAARGFSPRDIMAPPSRQQNAAKSSSYGFICDECNKTFATEMALGQHQEAPRQSGLRCCCKSFATVGALQQHQHDSH